MKFLKSFTKVTHPHEWNLRYPRGTYYIYKGKSWKTPRDVLVTFTRVNREKPYDIYQICKILEGRTTLTSLQNPRGTYCIYMSKTCNVTRGRTKFTRVKPEKPPGIVVLHLHEKNPQNPTGTYNVFLSKICKIPEGPITCIYINETCKMT